MRGGWRGGGCWVFLGFLWGPFCCWLRAEVPGETGEPPLLLPSPWASDHCPLCFLKAPSPSAPAPTPAAPQARTRPFRSSNMIKSPCANGDGFIGSHKSWHTDTLECGTPGELCGRTHSRQQTARNAPHRLPVPCLVQEGAQRRAARGFRPHCPGPWRLEATRVTPVLLCPPCTSPRDCWKLSVFPWALLAVLRASTWLCFRDHSWR